MRSNTLTRVSNNPGAVQAALKGRPLSPNEGRAAILAAFQWRAGSPPYFNLFSKNASVRVQASLAAAAL